MKISIILPVFNGERYLESAILSILYQSFEEFELIIVDDGSSDNSESIVNELMLNDRRIKYFKNKKNLGLPASLNHGIKKSKGQFITWTSHDNIFYEHALSLLYKSIYTHGADFVYSNCDVIDQDAQKCGFLNTKPAEHLFFGNVVHACFLYKREIHDNIGFYDENLTLIEDYDFWLRCSEHFKMINIENILYQYRFHKESLTNSIENNPGKKEIFEGNREIMFQKVLKDLNPGEKSLMNFFLNPSNAIYESMKEGKIKILLTDYRNLVCKFRYFDIKYSTQIFAFNFFDIAVRNPKFHNVGLLKLLFVDYNLWFNLSIKQNLVLVKKAIVG